MDVQEAYNLWALDYDSTNNKTRDLEAHSLRTVLAKINVETCIEAGCGTGKNTGWLATHATALMSLDLSTEMLERAKQKHSDPHIQYIKADLTKSWPLQQKAQLIVFSLVLEHIENLNLIFEESTKHLNDEGLIYISELHPFKQYSGSKARFECNGKLHTPVSFIHHLSDFVSAAKIQNLSIIDIKEFFDDDQLSIPRILTMVFKKISIAKLQ